MAIDIYGPGPRTVIVQGTAATNLSGHRVVRPDAVGTITYADPTDAATWRAGPWWLTQNAISVGASDDLLAVGEITEPSWSWTAGDRIYLGAAGVLTTTAPTAPTRQLQVAVAVTPTTLYFDPQMPIETA